MFHKFKITTYATVLLIGVFVLPYAGNVADVNAENYKCKGSKKQVRQCLKAVISERDKTIVELQAVLDKAQAAGGAGDADSCGDFSRLIRPPKYHPGRKAEDHRAERCYLCPPWDPHGPERMDPNYGCFTKDDPRYGKGGFD